MKNLVLLYRLLYAAVLLIFVANVAKRSISKILGRCHSKKECKDAQDLGGRPVDFDAREIVNGRAAAPKQVQNG